MAEIPSGSVVEGLLFLLHSSDKATRAEATRSLGEMGSFAIGGLLQALRDPKWAVRYRAVEALGMISDPQIDPVLIKALDDTRDHVRYIAAKMLGIRKTTAATHCLIKCLRDENEFVRISAARALGSLEDPRGIQALRNALGREPVERVAIEIKKSLGM
ncbi:MAG: HEAT repeat domain-containing protein [Methanomicrobiales archaeon]|nr:HEAT repeat domain-containing protein [Methanomicrobiales archaeon]